MYREIMWTDESEDHISRHDVTPAEIEDLVNSRPIFTSVGRDRTTMVHGMTDAGRYLLVVLSESMDGRWYVVTARDMTRVETRTFREKGR